MNALALLGGRPIRDLPYAPYRAIDDESLRRAQVVLQSGFLSGFVARGNQYFHGGPVVRELEDVLARYFCVRYAVTVNSATSGLHASLIAAGVGPGDEVLVPPLTMSATVAAVMMCRALPVFVDVEPDTYCIDASKIENFIGSRTKAIIAVNLFGQPAALRALREIADKHRILLIEDNAQAPGARYDGVFSGTIGHLGVLSFNHHKVIHCGEGGAVLTDDGRLAGRLQLARNHGEVVLTDWEDQSNADIVGYNYRLTEIQAALMIPQIHRLASLNQARIALAAVFTRKIGQFDFLGSVTIREDCTHVYYLYPVRYFPEKLGISRTTFLAALSAEGVHASSYVKPIHHLPIFMRYRSAVTPEFRRLFPGRDEDLPEPNGLCPVAERLSYKDLFVTNICRPPHTVNEVQEFVSAVEKISDSVPALQQWERRQSSR